MRKTKTIKIRTETRELLIITSVGVLKDFSWCDRCQSEIIWLSFRDAAKANEISEGELSMLMEAGRIHFSEMPDGHLLFCSNSITAPICDQPLLVKGDENEKTDF